MKYPHTALFEIIAPLSTFTTILLPGTVVGAWYARNVIANLNALLTSGLVVEGRIIKSKRYLAKGGWAIRITYEFLADGDVPQRGKLSILAKLVTPREKYTEGSSVSVVYLQDRPSVSIPTDLLAGKLATIARYNSLISPAWRVNLMLFAITWASYIFLLLKAQ